MQRDKKGLEEIELGGLSETFLSITSEIDGLLERRTKQALSVYELGLFSYLQRTLGTALTLLRGDASNSFQSKWGLLDRLFEDWKSREEGGFMHDPAGRLAWSQRCEQHTFYSDGCGLMSH